MNRPQVGVAVLIIRDGQVLLGRRKNSHGAGGWQVPGGHLEFGEEIEACAKREVLEETGLTISSIKLGPYTNDVFEQEQKHYITLFVTASASGTPRVMEPEKCEQWGWFNWNHLPVPLFLPLQNLLKLSFDPFGKV